MPSLQIRDIPKDLYDTLKKRAEKDHRSLAQQTIVILMEALYGNADKNHRRAAAIEHINKKPSSPRAKNIDIVDLIQTDRKR